MGLIASAVTAAGSVFKDQWKEYFYCDALPENVIVVRAHKKAKGMNHGNDNVITNGSVISVANGQCALILENGIIADICAEPGEYQYNNQVAPSVFTGSFGQGLKDSFAEYGRRFSFGGGTATDQRVYYVNTKEITGMKFGTPAPVPFRVVDQNIGLDIDISVKCFGQYSLKVTDPVLFYTNVCGNTPVEYTTDQINDQLRSELLSALQPAFAKISEAGIRYSSLPGHTTELTKALNEELSSSWKETRGLEIAALSISSIKASDEDEKMIKELQRNAVFRDPTMAAAQLTGAQAQAMQDAAKNANGAAMGFMNLNNAASQVNTQALYQMSQQNQTAGDVWYCPNCGTKNSGNFCTHCGTKKPE